MGSPLAAPEDNATTTTGHGDRTRAMGSPQLYVPRDSAKLNARTASRWQLTTGAQSAAAAHTTVETALYNARPCMPHHRLSNGLIELFMRQHLQVRTGSHESNA